MPGLGRHAPDGVQRVLQFPEDAPEPKQQRENAKAGGDEAAGAAGTLDRRLDRLGPGDADEVLHLIDDLALDRKSTRLNSSHPSISYAVFCLKKKNKQILLNSED